MSFLAQNGRRGDNGSVSSTDGQTWDIVVVGAGAAGAVIAARASEDPHRSVLLLDAGPDYPLAGDLPDDLYNGHDNSYTDHDWGLSYTPLDGRTDRFPRGRVTGGSTAVNTTIALRGIPADYDGWAERGHGTRSCQRSTDSNAISTTGISRIMATPVPSRSAAGPKTNSCRPKPPSSKPRSNMASRQVMMSTRLMPWA